VPLDFTSCYYQSSLLSFTSISQIFQSGQNQHCSADVCFYTYDTFYVDPCPIVRTCVYTVIDVCVQLLLYMFRGQHKIVPQHSRSKSSTKPPSPFLTCQFKMATRPLLFSRHPIPSAIEKYTPYEPYTTYFDRPLHQSRVFTTARIRLRRLKRDNLSSSTQICKIAQSCDVVPMRLALEQSCGITSFAM